MRRNPLLVPTFTQRALRLRERVATPLVGLTAPLKEGELQSPFPR